jgi:hypothetical protein
MGLKGVYPRWIVQKNISRNTQDGSVKSINSLVVVGDSKRENQLRVAKGFPKVDLQQNEVIIPKSF